MANDENDNVDKGAADEQIDPVVLSLLEQLWEAAHNAPGRPWSLAKLSKRTAISMSTLRRHLNLLDGAGLAQLTLHEDGTGCAALTVAGKELCGGLFPPPASNEAATK